MQINSPKHLKDIENRILEKIKFVKKNKTDLLEKRQIYCDAILEIYREALKELIDSSITYSSILEDIRSAYENSLHIRNERIKQFIVQDRVFGVSVHKRQHNDEIKHLIKVNNNLTEENLNLNFEIAKLKKENGKLKDENFSDYLSLMRERDARYTLYFENVTLHIRLRELAGGPNRHPVEDAQADPVVLRIALDRCREQLSSTQNELKRMKEEYSETVPRRDHDWLEAQHLDREKQLRAIHAEYDELQTNHKRLTAQKKSIETELIECKERCRELERAGTPRPHWDVCADFIGGGRERWWQLARGLSSRDKMRALLRELGPAAESEHLEYFDGLGSGADVPAYLRYEGRVRDLRLSRREVCVVVNDVWLSKLRCGRDVPMPDFLTKYFEDRYQQPSVRAEWAYSVCAGAERALDEPQVKLFWGALGGLPGLPALPGLPGLPAERLYWGLRAHWVRLRRQLEARGRGAETITIEEFERGARATFPLKSEVDIKNLTDAVKKQLKMKLNCNEVNLDKLFYEDEEGFTCGELARELLRQRRLAQHRYLRELAAALGGRRAAGGRAVGVDCLKRAFAIVDPAIDHVRMEQYIRWAFADQSSELGALGPQPLPAVLARLAAADVERVGPRGKETRRHYQ